MQSANSPPSIARHISGRAGVSAKLGVAPACAPIALDRYQDHLKYMGRAPRTLAELQFARNEWDHARRLAEIKQLAPKLALFDPFVQALAERGINLTRREFTTHDKGKTIRIMSSLFSSEHDKTLGAALTDLGFKEVDRKPWGSIELLTLKHGRALLVSIDIPKRETTA